MGFEIRITSSSPLEAMANLAAAATYCMYCPEVKTAADDILASDKSAATPGPRRDAPASGVKPPVTPPASNGYSAPPQNQPPASPAPNGYPAPPVGVPVNPMAAVANGPSGYGYVHPAPAPVGVPEAAPGNPTSAGTGPAAPMMTQTSLFNGQPVPAPGPIPVANAPTFTLEQIGKAGADLVTANPAKRAELNALLQQYGVQSVAELRPERLSQFAMALRGMGANL